MKFLPFLALSLAPLAAAAADFHATPEGAGRQDGKDWENALPGSALSAAFNERLQPGDRLLLGSGTYSGVTLHLSTGGNAGQPKNIVGVDRGSGLPILAGEWSLEAPTKGGTAIRIEPGVSHVSVEKLRLRGWVFGIMAPPVKEAGPRTHWTLRDVDVEQCRHGYYLSDCDDWTIEDADLRSYSKHGFRFDQGCDRVALKRCTADCSEGDAEWEKKTEAFPFGFIVNDSGAPNTAFRFEDCLAANNRMPLQKTRYKNGDGFVVEGNTTDVEFLRCRSLHNQDGGYDLKVADVRLTDCVALGNHRSFRIWKTATLTNCFAGWSNTGLWSNGGPIAVTRSTFHELRSEAVLSDDKSTDPITLRDCIVSATPAASRKSGKGPVVLENTIVATGPAEDPRYPRPDPKWDGLGTALDSQAFAEKGYRSPAIQPRK